MLARHGQIRHTEARDLAATDCEATKSRKRGTNHAERSRVIEESRLRVELRELRLPLERLRIPDLRHARARQHIAGSQQRRTMMCPSVPPE